MRQALQRTISIACHHYMGEVPIMREVVKMLGYFPLAKPELTTKVFLKQASNLLQTGQWVGLFPEGTQPRLQLTARQLYQGKEAKQVVTPYI